MTETLVPANFAGLRVVDSEIGLVIPVVDIAENLGYSRSTITKTIKENPSTFKGLKVLQALPTPGGEQVFLCLNSEGTDRLFLVSKPAKGRKDQYDRIQAFKEKAFGKLAELKRDTAPVSEGPDIPDKLRKAKEYAEIIGCDAKLLAAAVLAKFGEKEMADYLVPQTHQFTQGETGWYSPTELVALCNDPSLTVQRLNQYLYNNPLDAMKRPFQVKDENNYWRLEPIAQPHGREFTYRGRGGHTEPRIEWRESILYASGLKKQPITSDQIALTVTG